MHETCQKFHYFEIYIYLSGPSHAYAAVRGLYEVSKRGCEAMLRLASAFLLEKSLGGDVGD